MHRKLLFLLLILAGAGPDLMAQLTFSPYSRYGLGDIVEPNSGRNFAMGGIGIGVYDASTINRLNPASYASLRLTTFDISAFSNWSRIESNTSATQRGTSGFQNAAMAFSDRKNFGITFGLAPYSVAGYEITVSDPVMVDTSLRSHFVTYSSEGGLNQFYAGFGIRFLRRFHAGLNLTYAFGTTNYRWFSNFTDSQFQDVNVLERTNLRGLIPQFGLQYGDTISIAKTVDRAKEIDRRININLQNTAALTKKIADLEKEAAKLTEKNTKLTARKEKIVDEKTGLEVRISQLMDDEDGNKKEIGKLQDKNFRLEKKRKKIERQIKLPMKENRESRARTARSRQRLAEKRKELEKRKESIKEGKLDPTVVKRNRLNLRLGLIADPPVKLNGTRLIQFDNTAITDTLGEEEDGSVRLPSKVGVGFTLGKSNIWQAGIDVTWQDWNNFDYFQEANILRSSFRVNAGGEWIPGKISSRYSRRIAYRAGAYYNSTNLVLDGNALNEYGVTLGVGLPIGLFNLVARDFSRVNLGVSIGRRGALNSNPLQETVVRFQLGVNLNDVWFIKRRID